MATQQNTGGIRPVTLPNTFPPMPAVARILSRFDREQLAGFIAVAIDLADVMDGDADFEGSCDEDEVSRCTDMGRPAWEEGAGCEISDPGGCEHDGREEEYDCEHEQLPDDVPMLKVYSLELNPETGERDYLGRSNLMSTFSVASPGVRSADTGAVHIRQGAILPDQRFAPV